MKNLELVMYIYKTSGVATLLDIRRTCMYHHREVSKFLSFLAFGTVFLKQSLILCMTSE